jgi:hypothetical protein
MALNQNPISRLDAPLSRVAQDLEGSRFVSRQLCRPSATESLRGGSSGSRERPSGVQFLWEPSGPIALGAEPLGESITLGYSREPPVANR